ncbi:MAG: peptidylprolyl isomerase [Clostridia bacterium]|nr:peptidylprolyl isomerase [Clostridia bacterium]
MKTVKKIVSLIVIACMIGALTFSLSGCGLTTRTAGTVDGEDIPAGMYIYFLHSALYSLEQQYQYGQLSSEYSSEDESSDASSVESSEEPADESSEEADVDSSSAEEESSSAAEAESSSEESVDTNPATIWDAIVENKTAKDYVIDKAYENCAWVIVMEKKAAEYGIELTDEDKASMETTYSNNGGKLELEENLNAMGVSFSTYERIVKAGLIQAHLKELLYGSESKDAISEDAKKAEYDENYRRVKHILFKTNDLTDDTDDDGNVTKSVDEKKAEIKATYEAVLKRAQAGEDFEALIEEYSDDSMDKDKGYIFKKGDMVTAFEEAAWDLAVGEIATCESTYGWHIIKAYDKYEKEEYMNDTLADFISDYENEKYTEVEDKWISEAEVKRSSGAIRRYSPSDIYEDNSIASNVSAQIAYYNSYYSALLASNNG